MTASTLKRGVNYWSTYVLLVKDYIAFLGAKAIPLLGGVVTAGLLYPLPFAIMAAAIYAMMAGHHTSVITLSQWKFEVGVDSAFLYALILAGMTLTFSYFTTRAALVSTTSWQASLLWRAVNQLPVMARWDTETAIPMPLRLERLGSFLNSIIRSGFLVGRIVAIGLSNFVIATGALFVLTWLDPISVAVLILMAFLCLPLYAWALLGLVGVRQQSSRNRQQEQAMFKQVLQGVVSSTGRRIDTSQLTAEAARRFDSGYGTVNAQLQGLNLVSLILGLHVFASIAVIYVINGASLSAFLREKIVFFVILLFMMRSALGLALLISRLSRGYTSLATLRAYLHPRRKRVTALRNAPANAVFSLAPSNDGKLYPVCKGQPVFVVMPMASRAFELLPLSNALEIVKMPPEAVLRHIVFLDRSELEVLVEGDLLQVPDSTMQIGDKKQSLHLPVRHAAFEPDQLGVVALTQNAWEYLSKSDKAENFCRDRIVFVVVAEMKRPKPPSPGTLLVVSDGVEILAVGPFAESWDRAAEDAFQRAAKKDIKVDFDDDEETA
jgi:ABC-type multidrug transport system fused ATPase/permease subunit